MKRSRGTQSKRSRNTRSKGLVPITHYLIQFKAGEKARISVNPSVQKGRVSTLKYNNRVVEIIGKRGRAFEVRLRAGRKGKHKTFFVTNIHLKKI